MGALSENSFHAARKLENLFLFTLYELKKEARLPTATSVRGAEGTHWLRCLTWRRRLDLRPLS